MNEEELGGYIGIMDKKMETTTVYCGGYIGIMENRRKLPFRV